MTSERHGIPVEDTAGEPEALLRIPSGTAVHFAIFAALLAVLALAVYAGTLANGFVVDDLPFIQQNPTIRSLSNIPEMFTSGFWESTSASSRTFYRPLVTLSYAVNYALGRLDPFGYHLGNILLHWVNGLLVALLVAVVTRRAALAAVVATVFVLHPVASEAVAWGAGRSELLAALFCLATLVLYVRPHREGPRREAWTGLAGVLTFAFALLSKEGAIALLGVLLLFEATRGPRPHWRRFAPYLLIGAVYLTAVTLGLGDLRQSPITFEFNPLITEPLGPRILTGLALLWQSVSLWFFPVPLSADYSFNAIPVARTPADWRVLLGLVFLVASLSALFWTRRRSRLAFLGLSIMLAQLALLGINALRPVASLFAERFLYLPTAGFVVALMAGCDALLRSFGDRARIPAYLALVTVLVLSAARTAARTSDWHDAGSLFASAVAAQPRSAFAQASLSSAYFDAGEYREALHHARLAAEIYPQYYRAWLNLGDVALAMGALDEARTYLLRALELAPSAQAAHVSLGVAYARLGDLDQAELHYRRAVELSPRHPTGLNNLANVLDRRGKRQEAISLWQRTLEVDPLFPEALFNLGRAYEQSGREAEARVLYERFVRTAPARFAAQIDFLRAKLARQAAP